MQSPCGIAVRTALHYHQAHPEIVMRSDTLLLGIYRALRTLCRTLAPEEPELPDFTPLGTAWLRDMNALLMYEHERKKGSHVGS